MEFSDLSDFERRTLALHALNAAAERLDPRYFQDLTRTERIAEAQRWKAIADALCPDVFGHPNTLVIPHWVQP